MTRVRPLTSPTPLQGIQRSGEVAFNSIAAQQPSPQQSDSSGSSLPPMNTTHSPVLSLPGIEVLAEASRSRVAQGTEDFRKAHSKFRDYAEPKAHRTDGWKTAVYPQSARYHGPTSALTIFSEDRTTHNENLLRIDEETRAHPGAWRFGEPLRK